MRCKHKALRSSEPSLQSNLPSQTLFTSTVLPSIQTNVEIVKVMVFKAITLSKEKHFDKNSNERQFVTYSLQVRTSNILEELSIALARTLIQFEAHKQLR